MEGTKLLFWSLVLFFLLRPAEFGADQAGDNGQTIVVPHIPDRYHRPREDEETGARNKVFRRWPRSVDKAKTKEHLTRSSPIRQRNSADFHQALYGTQEGVEHLLESYGPRGLAQAKRDYEVYQEMEEVREANKHFLFIRKTARCRQPRPKVIRVNEFYPSPIKEYLPRGTILHRCDNESGCCEDGFECVPKLIQEVALYFYVTYKERLKVNMDLGNSVEKLLFTNHTECHCQHSDKNTSLSEDKSLGSESSKSDISSSHHPHQQNQNFIKCKHCPLPFTRREFPDNRCSCDCFDKQRSCIRIKRGRQALADTEKRCVASGECHVPECDTGLYDVISGRCPRRPDDHYRRRPIHRGDADFNSNRMWFERD